MNTAERVRKELPKLPADQCDAFTADAVRRVSAVQRTLDRFHYLAPVTADTDGDGIKVRLEAVKHAAQSLQRALVRCGEKEKLRLLAAGDCDDLPVSAHDVEALGIMADRALTHGKANGKPPDIALRRLCEPVVAEWLAHGITDKYPLSANNGTKFRNVLEIITGLTVSRSVAKDVCRDNWTVGVKP